MIVAMMITTQSRIGPVLPSVMSSRYLMTSDGQRDPLTDRALAVLNGHYAAARRRDRTEVGYTSEYAFNPAFTRLRGSPPGRYKHTRSDGSQHPLVEGVS